MRRRLHPFWHLLLALLLLGTQVQGLQHGVAHALAPWAPADSRLAAAHGPAASADAAVAGGGAVVATTAGPAERTDPAGVPEPATDSTCLLCLALAAVGLAVWPAALRWCLPRGQAAWRALLAGAPRPAEPAAAYAARAPPVATH